MYSSVLTKALLFGPRETAWCCATQAIACVVGPLVAGQLADRYFPSERCITVCSLIAGTALLILGQLTAPFAVFLATLVFWLSITPVFTLGTALCFAHLPHPDRQFGPTRMWGTVGWVSAALFLFLWCQPHWLWEMLRVFGTDHRLTDSYGIGAGLSFLLAFYSLTLPHTPPQRQASTWLAPLGAMRLLRRPAFAVYFACVFGLYMTLPFSTQVTPLLVIDLGVPEPDLPLWLTMSQSAEVLTLAILPFLVYKFGVRACMIVGMTAWLGYMSIQAVGEPLPLVISSLVLNGLFITCFVVAGQVFLNRHAHGEVRASAQALLVCVMGVGLFLGNLLVGEVRAFSSDNYSVTFSVAVAITLAALLVFLFGFDADDATEVVPAGPVTHGATIQLRVQKSATDR